MMLIGVINVILIVSFFLFIFFFVIQPKTGGGGDGFQSSTLHRRAVTTSSPPGELWRNSLINVHTYTHRNNFLINWSNRITQNYKKIIIWFPALMCTNDFVLINEKCLKLNVTAYSKPTAETICNEVGATLLSINSLKVIDFQGKMKRKLYSRKTRK